jgi:F0F1-type ATP synthase assembly protein I
VWTARRKAAGKLKNLKPRDLSTLSLVTQLGFTVVTALVLSLLLGLWLDRQLGTSPLMVLVFSMLGILVGTVGVYRLVTKAINQAVENTPRRQTAERPAEPEAEGWEDEDAEKDPWAEDEEPEDDWERDPWRDGDEPAAERRRARQEETERRLGIRPPKLRPKRPEEEQR